MSAPTLSPQILGRAEAAHRALLTRLLAGSGITYPSWVVLSLTTAGGGSITADALVARVRGALKIEESAALGAIDELRAANAVRADPDSVRVTAAGKRLHRDVRSSIDKAVGRLYAGIPSEDLSTAGRVLAEITARADAELTET